MNTQTTRVLIILSCYLYVHLPLTASYAQVCTSSEKPSWQNLLLEIKCFHTKNTQICYQAKMRTKTLLLYTWLRRWRNGFGKFSWYSWRHFLSQCSLSVQVPPQKATQQNGSRSCTQLQLVPGQSLHWNYRSTSAVRFLRPPLPPRSNCHERS